MICCIAKLFTSEILSQLNAGNFVVIELDESPDISKHEQLSLVFRCVYNFQVFERFVEFIDCSAERSAEEIAKIALSKIEQYGVGNKLVAQTYDGASVMSGEISVVNVRIKEKYREALFVHCYAHKLNFVLT